MRYRPIESLREEWHFRTRCGMRRTVQITVIDTAEITAKLSVRIDIRGRERMMMVAAVEAVVVVVRSEVRVAVRSVSVGLLRIDR